MFTTSKYKVHMVSFCNTQENGYNVIMGAQNAQPWHITALEIYLAELKAKVSPPAGSEFA